MTKPKAVVWLSLVAGLLWILAGIRDIFAPGFFSISSQPVSSSSITLSFVVGIVFLIIASSQAVKSRHL